MKYFFKGLWATAMFLVYASIQLAIILWHGDLRRTQSLATFKQKAVEDEEFLWGLRLYCAMILVVIAIYITLP